MADPQFSDLPAGAKVVSAPTFTSATQYSDLPPGATVVSSPARPLLSVDDFAARIKAKYPDYAGMDNTTLAQKVIAKHPEYASQVSIPDYSGNGILGKEQRPMISQTPQATTESPIAFRMQPYLHPNLVSAQQLIG
jgi:hypothetical protein